MWKRHVSLHDTIFTPPHTPAHTCLLEHTPPYNSYFLNPVFSHLAISLVESSEATIWRHHRPELVEFVDPWMMGEEGWYTVLEMLKDTNIDVMKNIGYDNSHWRDAFYIPPDTVWESNHSTLQILSCFLHPRLISLSREYHRGSRADSLIIATTMNSHLQTTISVVSTEGNGANRLGESECFQSSLPSMHRWDDNIAASDRPHEA